MKAVKIFRCSFPECTYETSSKALIDFHHILPKSLGGSNKPSNLISLCSNHHRLIFVKEAMKGFHSILQEDSIEILGVLGSTSGSILHYRTCKDNLERFYSLKDRKIL